jgi:predicted DNA binding CopG/RHH family protein
MLNNLQTIKQTTKESIELLAQIQSDIDTILKSGIFDDYQTKQKHWKRVNQLLHNEDNVLVQIDNVQSYLYGVMKELDKIKPTRQDEKHRKQMMDNFLDSMKFQEYAFANKDELTRIFVEDKKIGLIKSVVSRLRGLFGDRNIENNKIMSEEDDPNFKVKPDQSCFVKEKNIELTNKEV